MNRDIIRKQFKLYRERISDLQFQLDNLNQAMDEMCFCLEESTSRVHEQVELLEIETFTQ
jgi:hypothetical protein